MARRIPIQPVALALALAAVAPAGASRAGAAPAGDSTPVTAPAEGGVSPGTVVARYGFDDGSIDTGPDTFSVFQRSSGHVRLTTDFRYSGYRSVEVRDAAGDGAFPELQGYFPLRREGTLRAHFALMIAEPREQLNIALAGPAWFSLRKDGIAFWLQTRDGVFHHYSDSMPKRLLPVRPFVWYLVDVAYDIDAGVYDLDLREAGAGGAHVSLKRQANTVNAPGSAVDKFSFIGDTGHDTSSVVYYLDDVLITVDRPIEVPPLVAPGRRKLFIDMWIDAHRLARSRTGCLPVLEWPDLGLDDGDLVGLRLAGLVPLLERLVAGDGGSLPDGAPAAYRETLQAIRSWRSGCRAFADGDAKGALERFEAAIGGARGSRLFEMSAILALASLGRWPEADARLAAAYGGWIPDPRLPVALALIGLERDDLEEAALALQNSSEPVPDDPRLECSLLARSRLLDPGTVAMVRARFPEDWATCLHAALLPEVYFYVQLFRKDPAGALRYATRMERRMQSLRLPEDGWIERMADASLLGGDARYALTLYTESLRRRGPDPWLLSKIADVHLLLGDVDRERVFREAVYGSLGDAGEPAAAAERP
jgi:tetratricopeptide (TPR) repeat protein